MVWGPRIESPTRLKDNLPEEHTETRDLIARGATCIAYETVTDADDGLPLLARMSQAVDRMAIQAGAQHHEALGSGADLLLGRVPGPDQPTCSSTIAASMANTPLR